MIDQLTLPARPVPARLTDAYVVLTARSDYGGDALVR